MTSVRGVASVLCWASLCFGAVFDLSQLHWTLRNQNGSIAIPAVIPSQAHLDLTRAGIITDPMLGLNDFTERWIFMDNWTYTASLAPILSGLKSSQHSSQHLLVFHGLDTIANITVANKPVAWVNNQFRQYVFDVSFLNNVTAGNITVDFESAYYYGRNVSSRPDAEDMLESYFTFEVPASREYIRKTDSDFGWDWGPAFVPSGIFKPAYLISLSDQPKSKNHDDQIYFEETSIDIYKVGQNFSVRANQHADWVVNVTLALRSGQNVRSPTISLSLPEAHLQSPVFHVSAIPRTTNEAHWVTVLWHIPDKAVKRWYPHNLGTPKLYDLSISLGVGGNPITRTLRTGFRTIELVQSPYSKKDVTDRGITPGDQWHFEVNGEEFYSLGTNIIPFDPFYSKITTEQVRWVLESAVLSGQNMVRIWGGGIYQPDNEKDGVYDFYSLCDELGILAWSEFIFSDSVYPINDFMLESIEPEVRQNVRRVNRHPSNAQWAGGNEIEGIVLIIQALAILPNASAYLDEYLALFQDFLYKVAVSETHSVAYTDCSTTRGVLSLEPYQLRLTNATPGEIYGNTERYNYDASQAFNYSTFPVSRFVNEFGFHSMPSFYAWETVLESAADFSFNSTVVASRDHHPPAGGLAFPNPNANQGQAQMTQGVQLWLPTPSTANSNQTFAQWCWSTQIFQTMAMTSQIAWYRRGSGQGERNLGSLVWQMNDIWVGTSWSAMEYDGRWKVLQYGMTTAYSPLVIYPFWTPQNETLEVIVTSDRLETVKGSAQLTWYDWHGKTLKSSTHKFATPALNNSRILTASGLASILPAGQNASNVWMLLNITAQVNGKRVTNEQYFTPTSLAHAPLVDPKILVTSDKSLTFTLSARGGVAPWTWLDHPAGTVGYFQDTKTGLPANGFYLVPGIPRTVKFIMNQHLSRNKNPSRADFVLRSLWNNTHV
ncbi:Glycoside hydrolase family 2 protein [Mycena indigotica]|uniref:Beta-mannosidase A n=1 Tax=Mycena indigotica TaxID=2126181 RepID=A0A8H6TE66_9AGAR|nr:Glycoside hydrolase family 2 protein [Mycena indigotica]KAF7315112.1 Glycoside hydrolase family 2 protein [Mycena indigotica]